jgi:hypothetical protein
MKKYLVIGIITLFFVANIVSEAEKNLHSFDDELDQQQTFCNMMGPFGYDPDNDLNWANAQSFTPQKNILTRVYLYICRFGQPYPFDLAIRKELNEENLTTVSLNYNQIPPEDHEWVEFNFDDIPVIAGEKYYIVISTQSIWGEVYGVGAGTYNPYPYGELWYTYNWQQWGKDADSDLCFKTYGKGGRPNKPSMPSGETSGEMGVIYEYSTSTTDPDGDQIWYWFDWGDGTNSGWVGPYPSGIRGNASHAWSSPGKFFIKAKAKDEYDAESDWSPSLTVNIMNAPPNKPSMPSGETSGEIGVSYEYSTSTTDPDGDQIWYWFDWGDGTNSGWIGLYDSGDTVSESHKWTSRGNYEIKVKSKDIYDYESDWSDPLIVTMPRNRAINTPFQWFLQQYPYLFPILRHLLRL